MGKRKDEGVAVTSITGDKRGRSPRIYLPKKICARLGLEKGVHVKLTVSGGRLIVEKLEV